MEEVTVVDVRPQLVAGIRKRGYYREIAELLPRLYEYATEKGAKFTNPLVFVCHETAEDPVLCMHCRDETSKRSANTYLNHPFFYPNLCSSRCRKEDTCP